MSVKVRAAGRLARVARVTPEPGRAAHRLEAQDPSRRRAARTHPCHRHRCPRRAERALAYRGSSRSARALGRARPRGRPARHDRAAAARRACARRRVGSHRAPRASACPRTSAHLRRSRAPSPPAAAHARARFAPSGPAASTSPSASLPDVAGSTSAMEARVRRGGDRGRYGCGVRRRVWADTDVLRRGRSRPRPPVLERRAAAHRDPYAARGARRCRTARAGRSSSVPSVCGFGARAGAMTVALVGDSHAGHWRAALDHVAQAKGWRGLSITHSSCPLQKALRDLPEPRRTSCARWKRGGLRVVQATSRGQHRVRGRVDRLSRASCPSRDAAGSRRPSRATRTRGGRCRGASRGSW